MKKPIFVSFYLLQILTHFPSTSAVEYDAVNAAPETPGGHRFDAEIGIPYTKSIMKTINYFISDILQQYSEPDRKNVQVVKLFIHQFDGAEAITYGEMINVSAIYLAGYKGNLKWEFTSLLHHEMTHVFQWNGEGNTPVGLVEGIADYMILKSGYYPPGFAKPGQGERWDQGYDFTARFLEYCDGLKSGFVAGLNKMMRHNYSEEYFVELTGKPVGQLWAEYKALYGGV
ncbi:Basic secretory protease [Sesamum alatum]|uniref:Basic secretory protease n=1 Tax=Sesamum alatum TaxID=300844 RepID=A0AAE1YX76_9LAMI|nr:Basic secretory protease [Sesamum alatum]